MNHDTPLQIAIDNYAIENICPNCLKELEKPCIYEHNGDEHLCPKVLKIMKGIEELMEEKNNLLNIYGARESARGNGVNITLVTGEGENKQFYNCFVSYGFKNYCHAEKTEDGNFAIIVKKLSNDKPSTYKQKQEEVADEDLPF